jgi:hypothetical protein
VTEDSYRVGTADDVDDVDQVVDDDVPADAPRIHGQIIHVTIRDGAGVREFDVHVTNRDYLAWDMTGPKRGWDMRKQLFLFQNFIAWSAAKRDGQFDGPFDRADTSWWELVVDVDARNVARPVPPTR